MGFPRQEYWSGLPSSPPGDITDPGIQPASLTSSALAGGFFTISTTWEAHQGFAEGEFRDDPQGVPTPEGPTTAWCLGLVPYASASGPRGEARLGLHLVVVKVPVDGEAVSPDPLGLTGRSAPGPPLDHTGGVTLGPHQLWGLLLLLHWLCGKNGQGGQAQGRGAPQRQNSLHATCGSLACWDAGDSSVNAVPGMEAGVQPV